MREIHLVHSQTGKAQVVPFHILQLQLHPSSQPEGPTTSQQSLFVLQTTMEPLLHGLWSCSSKPLTGRTGLQTEGRFSLLELHWRYHYSLVYRNPPPDKDSLQRRHALLLATLH